MRIVCMDGSELYGTHIEFVNDRIIVDEYRQLLFTEVDTIEDDEE